MISFLLTNWWIYIPIIVILLFLTHRNKQKINQIKSLHDQSPQNAHNPIPENPPGYSHTSATASSARLTRLAGRLGLKGAVTHIRRK